MAESPRSFLLVPAGGAGDGVGHLARCIRLARRLGPRVTFLSSQLDPQARGFLTENLRAGKGRARLPVLASIDRGAFWDIILLDRRETPRSTLEGLSRHGAVVCLDEGGEAREYASFLVDTLPNLRSDSPPNVSSPSFLELPRRVRRGVTGRIRKVLVSFGGEDGGDLSGRMVDAIREEGLFPDARVTLVEGPLFARRSWPKGVTVLKGVRRLAAVIAGHDLLFTHFGMTAFEALAVGVPAILLNPTEYHRRLSAAAGIPEIGVRIPNLGKLRDLLGDPRKMRDLVEGFNANIGAKRGGRLARLLLSLDLRGASACPVCASSGHRVIARFPDRTYRHCARCGIEYLQPFAAARKEYGKEYFSSEYRAQYGRTYLEDFDSIKQASRARIELLLRIGAKAKGGALVDVGCAFGPFLDAAREAGLPCFGLDVSAQAIGYVKKKLRIPAVRAAFEEAAQASFPHQISCVTLWYVLEHFRDTARALRKAAALLPRGGLFAFSTPNGRGISARKGIGRFLEKSPPDHFTIFSPRGLRALLAVYGFQLRVVRVTGHHPERFPGFLGRAAGVSPPVHRLLLPISRLLGLGDTFEAYAVKRDLS